MKKQTFPFEVVGKSKPYIGSEDAFQKSTARILATEYSDIIAFHVPNGGKRHWKVGREMKLMGTKAGVADWIILEPRGKFHGLVVELKVKKGTLQTTQKDFLEKCSNNLYLTVVCYNIDSFREVLKNYLYAND